MALRSPRRCEGRDGLAPQIKIRVRLWVVSQLELNGRSPQVIHREAGVMNTRSRSVLGIPQNVVFSGLD